MSNNKHKKRNFSGLHFISEGAEETDKAQTKANEVTGVLKTQANALSNEMQVFNKELVKIKSMKEEYDKEFQKNGLMNLQLKEQDIDKKP